MKIGLDLGNKNLPKLFDGLKAGIVEGLTGKPAIQANAQSTEELPQAPDVLIKSHDNYHPWDGLYFD